jgi:hypothetical protein
MKDDNREEQEDEIDGSDDAVESESTLMLLTLKLLVEMTPNRWTAKPKSRETRDIEMMVEPLAPSSWSEHCPTVLCKTTTNAI